MTLHGKNIMLKQSMSKEECWKYFCRHNVASFHCLLTGERGGGAKSYGSGTELLPASLKPLTSFPPPPTFLASGRPRPPPHPSLVYYMRLGSAPSLCVVTLFFFTFPCVSGFPHLYLHFFINEVIWHFSRRSGGWVHVRLWFWRRTGGNRFAGTPRHLCLSKLQVVQIFMFTLCSFPNCNCCFVFYIIYSIAYLPYRNLKKNWHLLRLFSQIQKLVFHYFNGK